MLWSCRRRTAPWSLKSVTLRRDNATVISKAQNKNCWLRTFNVPLYLKSASARMLMLSQSTAERSCSCWILPFQSPSLTLERERKASPEGSHEPPVLLQLSTSSTQWDRTALLSRAGPWKPYCINVLNKQKTSSVCGTASLEILIDVTRLSVPWCCFGSAWVSGCRGSHLSQCSGFEVMLQVHREDRASDRSSHQTNGSSSAGWKITHISALNGDFRLKG